jgi:hypothetical protein
VLDAGAADSAVPDAAVAVKPALLHIESVPPADVMLDEKTLGQTPLDAVEVEPGEHLLTFSSKKPKLTQTQKITVTEGETRTLQVKLKRKASAPTPPPQ